MSGSTVLRGDFGGDHFTRLHNNVFRGRVGQDWWALVPNEMAVLGHVSTHIDGWETSARRIADSMGIGLTTVKSALRGLESKHYVMRGQDRDEDTGVMGAGWLYCTDKPAQLAEDGITDPDVVRRVVEDAMRKWKAKRAAEDPRSGSQPPVLSCENTPVEDRTA